MHLLEIFNRKHLIVIFSFGTFIFLLANIRFACQTHLSYNLLRACVKHLEASNISWWNISLEKAMKL